MTVCKAHILSDAAAEMELNEQISIPFAPPELIPYLHPQRKMVHMEACMDVSLDGWAEGCFLHEMGTCALPDWHETFFPVEAIVQGEGLTRAERMAIYVPAMQAEHQKQVSRLSQSSTLKFTCIRQRQTCQLVPS